MSILNKKRMLVILLIITTAALMIGCGTAAETTVEEPRYADGVYTGEAQGGAYADLTVEVTVANGEITAIEMVEHNATEGIGTSAADRLAARMIEQQDAEVDTVAGATLTTTAFIEAVNAALIQAE
jgi:uncharacterized protein with FMN-binding domain